MYSLIYVVIYFLIFILSIPLFSKKTIGNSSFNYDFAECIKEFSVFLVLLVFLGLRGYVATDYVNYYPFFQDIPSLFDSDFSLDYFNTNGWEKGYLLYALICKTICPSFIFFQFISVLIDFLFIRYFIRLYLPNNSRIFAYAMFFSFYGLGIEFNLYRNIKALLIFLYSLRFILSKQFWKFSFCIFLACLFHKSSIIFLPFYFFIGKQWKRKTVFSLWIIGNLICILRISYLKNLGLLVSDFLPGLYGDLLKLYFNSEKYGAAYSLGFGWLERQISFFLVFYYGRNTVERNSMANIFLNFTYIYFFIWLYCAELSIFIERIALLFVFGFWFIVPYIYSKISRKGKLYFLVYFLFMGFLKVFTGYNVFVYNYKLIMFDDFETRKNLFFKKYK